MIGRKETFANARNQGSANRLSCNEFIMSNLTESDPWQSSSATKWTALAAFPAPRESIL
jgi:hypothetical protein